MPSQNTKPTDYPQAVLQQIALLAQNIVIARKRRKETQAQWAQRLGVSQPTMARIERGDPSVSMASYVMCMWLINQAQGLADLIAPQNDLASLELEVARARLRPDARATAQKQAKAPKKISTKTTSKTQVVAIPTASKVNAPSHSRVSHLAREERSLPEVDRTNAAKSAAWMATGLDHEEQIKKAMQMATGLGHEGLMTESMRVAAGLDHEEEIKRAMQMATGLGHEGLMTKSMRVAAGLDHEEEIKRAMQMAIGTGREEEIARALGISGLGTSDRLPNSTAAGLAALISGQKKARP